MLDFTDIANLNELYSNSMQLLKAYFLIFLGYIKIQKNELLKGLRAINEMSRLLFVYRIYFHLNFKI